MTPTARRSDKDLIAHDNHRAAVAAELAASRKALAERGTVVCSFCGEDIEPIEIRKAWPEVTGYAPPRSAGGTNALAFQAPTGRLVHDQCGRGRRLGLDAQQESML